MLTEKKKKKSQLNFGIITAKCAHLYIHIIWGHFFFLTNHEKLREQLDECHLLAMQMPWHHS